MKYKIKIILSVITTAVFISAFTLNIQSSLNDPVEEVIDEVVTSKTVVVVPCVNATIDPMGFFKQMICLDENYEVYCKNEYYVDYISTGECRFEGD